MRVVTTPNFCKACLEGLWHSLLRRVDFIDDVLPGCRISPGYPTSWKRTLDLKLVPLAQFREAPDLSLAKQFKESYSITWSKDGDVLEHFNDQTHIEVDDTDGDGVGVYSIEVKFRTEEVRVDPQGLLISSGDFNVGERCGMHV